MNLNEQKTVPLYASHLLEQKMHSSMHWILLLLLLDGPEQKDGPTADLQRREMLDHVLSTVSRNFSHPRKKYLEFQEYLYCLRS
jgi:hypothetical protein